MRTNKQALKNPRTRELKNSLVAAAPRHLDLVRKLTPSRQPSLCSLTLDQASAGPPERSYYLFRRSEGGKSAVSSQPARLRQGYGGDASEWRRRSCISNRRPPYLSPLICECLESRCCTSSTDWGLLTASKAPEGRFGLAGSVGGGGLLLGLVVAT
jgi:hypothetical protein